MKGKAPSYRDFRPTSKRASLVGRRNRRRDTAPEMLLRRALWKAGGRYRLHDRRLTGKPDIVFPRARLAVFCDGDFWHGREWEARRTRLERGSNAAYWVAKIGRNLERDQEVNAGIEALGWQVVRVWESEVRRDPESVASRILDIVRSRVQ